MKTNSKLSAYIFRGSTTALFFSCVIVALCSAITLPEQPPKARPPRGNAVFGGNGHESGTLSFAERVTYQRAIEDVYWRHRIWPKPLESWSARAQDQMPKVVAAATANYTLPAISDQPSECIDDSWTATSITNAPTGR